MAKDKAKALAFIQRNTQVSSFEEGFEARETIKSSNFRQEFLVAPLSEEENMEIQVILSGNDKDETQVAADYKRLAEITSQIRAIDRQGVLLHGERIAKARDLLKNYVNGSFSKWLILAYGNRQTPHSMLQYYEFFMALGSDIQGLLHAMPRKAAYVLASREGNNDLKVEIIKKHHSKPRNEIVDIIQKTFPLDTNDRRKSKKSGLFFLNGLRNELMQIARRKEKLPADLLIEITEIKNLIEEILQKNSLVD